MFFTVLSIYADCGFYLQRLKVEISTKLLKDNADLKAQIVRSPDRQRKEISEMSSQRIELQNTVQAYRNKTRDLTGRIDTMGELEFVRQLWTAVVAKLTQRYSGV